MTSPDWRALKGLDREAALLKKVGPCTHCPAFYGMRHDDEEYEGEISKACPGRAPQRRRYLDEISTTRNER